ncbi:carboxypeptidase-like regulatory domain-containing protein [Salibacteraceae bacterium]|nr:carboxypeptidase-like regulatory domain-containing protein [Salibacteraceae bacterium]
MKKSSPQSIQLQIPTPCSEDWNKMTPADKGRHCASCAKIVTDFTTMSDDELINFLGSGNVSGCGRVRPDQLERTILPEPLLAHWALPTFVVSRAFAIVAAVFTSLGPLESLANGPTPKTEIVHGGIRAEYHPQYVKIIGRVTSSGMPIPDINVRIAALGLDTVTDDSGHFELRVPWDQNWVNAYIQFEHPAYLTQSIQITGAKFPLEVEMISAMCDIDAYRGEYMISGGMTATLGVIETRASWPRRQWWKIKRLFSFRRFRAYD